MAPRTRDCCHPLSPKKRNSIFLGASPRPQEPIRQGEILCDVSQKKWKIGRCIGVGAFGEVYLVSDDISKSVTSDAQYVIKVEPHSNGPLFVEMNFYLRATKPESIERWKRSNQGKAIGVPKILGFGSHTYKNDRYRFIVLPRFGLTVSKLFLQSSRKFHIKTAFTLASHVLDILEYIHSQGYVHLDIKGANMLMGDSNHNDAPLYLLDYGLAVRYTDMVGKHKEYHPDKRKAEAGTLEYISRDAHLGAMSRRSDLESLGFNLVHWLTGSLPWLNVGSNAELVAELKNEAMSNIKTFLMSSFNEPPPSVLTEFLLYVDKLGFKSDPDYEYCRKLFNKGIRDSGFLDDGLISFDSHAKLPVKSKKRKGEIENYSVLKRPKIKKNPFSPSNRRPFRSVAQNSITTRVTRNQVDSGIKLRSARDFDWATVLAGHPEAKPHKPRKERTIKQSVSPPKDVKKVLTIWEDSLRNPTPAMLKLMTKDTRRRHSDRKNKSDSIGPPCYLTPAMEEVIANRRGSKSLLVTPSPKALRSSRRKIARKSADAIYACATF